MIVFVLFALNLNLLMVELIYLFIFFLFRQIIRQHWFDRGAYRPLREALSAMREHATENNVSSIAMGRLGAQDDGLNFMEVMKEVKNTFYDSSMNLIIYARQT
jgi:hypothetical protein